MTRDPLVRRPWMIGLLMVITVMLSVFPWRGKSGRREGFASEVRPEEMLQAYLRRVREEAKTPRVGAPSELFVVGPEKFTWEEARGRCGRYGGRLATEGEAATAFRQGSHWCEGAWTEEGKVVYGVDPSSREECGNEAVPGFRSETYPKAIRFAAACYGPRPDAGPSWQKEREARYRDQEARRLADAAAQSASFLAQLHQRLTHEDQVRADMQTDEVRPHHAGRLQWSASSSV